MALGQEVREGCAAIARDARSVRIDLDALDALDPGPPPELDPQRHYLEGPAHDVATYLLDARRDQLRLGLVPDAAASAPAARATSRSRGRWPTASGAHGAVVERRAARDAHRGGRRHARPARRPRAHVALRPGAARARALPRRPPRRSTSSPRPAARPQRFARRWPTAWRCGTTAASTSARRSPPATSRSAASRDFARPRRADDLRRQPRPPRPALRRRARLRRRPRRAHRRPGGCCPPGRAEREIRACAVHACEQLAPRASA